MKLFRHLQQKLRNYCWQRTKRIRDAEKILNKLYHSVVGECISKQARDKLAIQNDEFLYGEIEYLTFAALLEQFNITANDIFYDLGSGTGKAVMTAALLKPFKKCIGIELLPQLFQQSEVIAKQLSQQYPHTKAAIHFIHADLFSYDFSDADVIFINATAFFSDRWQAIQEKLARLKSGSRIIITSKKLNTLNFALMYQSQCVMSWGWCSVSIYKTL